MIAYTFIAMCIFQKGINILRFFFNAQNDPLQEVDEI